MYDIIVKNGLVIDPAQGIHEKKDIGLLDGNVAAIESRIGSGQAKKTIDASGMIVTPGLIDIHTHISYKIVNLAIDPMSACLAKGSTTVLDAGSTGELLFPAFRKYVINACKTRIYALLNIESLGMIEFADNPPLFTNQSWPMLITGLNELLTSMFINMDDTVKMIEENGDVILGIKWAHHGLRALELAREAADKARCLLMAENRYMPEALSYLKKGDIVTHLFLVKDNVTHDGGLVDDDMKVQPELFEAVKRGVILDIGHGQGSFSWKVAEEAFRQGIRPDTISTDLWIGNINGPVYDMPTTMAKFLLLGMSLDDVIKASTARPAEILGKQDEIGTLKPGACADLAIFKLEEGRFPLIDSYGEERLGRQRLVPVNIIRSGIEYR